MPDTNFNLNPNSLREVREPLLGQRNVAVTELQSLVNEHVTFASRIRALRVSVEKGNSDDVRSKMRQERCEAMSKYLTNIDKQIVELIQVDSSDLYKDSSNPEQNDGESR